MARYYGKIGYVETAELVPGNWVPVVTERTYCGDLIRNARRLENTDGSTNDSPVLNNSVSIVADEYAYEHFSAIRYIVWMGVLWKVTNIEVQRPRLILTIGGLWNGDKA